MFVVNRIVNRRRLLASMDVDEESHSTQSVGKRSESTGGNERRKSQPQLMESRIIHPELRQLYKRLSVNERRALRVTWNRLKGPVGSQRNAIQLLTLVLQKTIEKDPETKKLFFQATFIEGMNKKQAQAVPTVADHAKHFVSFLDKVICYLNQISVKELNGPCHIGEMHSFLKAYGLQAKVWDVFGQYFADAIATQECVKIYPHAQKAWNILIACVTDRMRASFEIKPANRRRSSSATNGDQMGERDQDRLEIHSARSCASASTSNGMSTDEEDELGFEFHKLSTHSTRSSKGHKNRALDNVKHGARNRRCSVPAVYLNP